MAKYLGLDLSTQSMSAIVIDDQDGKILCEESINFGQDLPSYNAPSGFVSGDLEGEIFSDPRMWLDALNLLLERLQSKTELSQISAICGSGQQHATVYLNNKFPDRLSEMNVNQSFTENLTDCFSRDLSPIWMDNSTTAECQEIANAVGGNEKVLEISGSFAIERFSGPQIRKFAATSPQAYEETAAIHLASSFCCSVVAGQSAPIDFGDGAGMNLMSLKTKNWDIDLINATADKLIFKLPVLAAADSKVSLVSKYLVEKYGFAKNCEVFAFSGDNPNSLIGCGGSLPGTAVISLGTSDTFFAAMSKPVFDPQGFGHVFGNPAGGFMSLICFRNGSLTREQLRDHFNLDWDQFSDALKDEVPSVKLPWLIDELTPRVPASQDSLDALKKSSDVKMIRDFIEGQFLNMLYHSQWMGETINHVILTGGASQNDAIAQIIADIFNSKVDRLEVSNSAALGAAMRGCQAYSKTPWERINSQFILPADGKSLTPNNYDCTGKLAFFEELLKKHLA
jgi:xylulokinase